ncbi:hypothetical protein [Candidatus Ferrigenium straubiae]|jgi:hypothetical protein|uniref:hypothetical protein n=1 Tax=Candidatus Ferrigenium straubiae TaxID=2919506 RepID=UPI003F4A9235
MKLTSINDITFESAKANTYDLAIFACGYESRCQFISSQLNHSNINRQLIFGFEFVGDAMLRAESDKHFQQKWGIAPTILPSPNELEVYRLLNQEIRDSKAKISRVLVDYSSMSRSWYAAILNWFRFSELQSEVVVDFVYSAGEYSGDFAPISVESILPLPGCEGSSGTVTKSIAVMGLGFENLAPLCVLDKLQPDEIFAYFASPSLNESYPTIARSKNKELIDVARETLELPLTSIELTVAKLAEVISPYLKTADITFVPMGPKPHVLATILLAIRFNQVTCLHVHGKCQNIADIVASGDVIATSLQFRH